MRYGVCFLLNLLQVILDTAQPVWSFRNHAQDHVLQKQDEQQGPKHHVRSNTHPGMKTKMQLHFMSRQPPHFDWLRHAGVLSTARTLPKWNKTWAEPRLYLLRYQHTHAHTHGLQGWKEPEAPVPHCWILCLYCSKIQHRTNEHTLHCCQWLHNSNTDMYRHFFSQRHEIRRLKVQ